MIIKMSLLGNSLGTRSDAEKLRIEILKSEEMCVLDFADVSIVSNSFADELLGIIVRDFGMKTLKEKVILRSANVEVSATIRTAILNRAMAT